MMPLYEYKCKSCGLKFEELMTGSEDTKVACRSCGGESERQMSRFSSSISGGGANESVDMAIGREAEARWQGIHERREKRIGGKKLEAMTLPQSKDGKFMPVMALGDQGVREKKTEYVSVLQTHRKKRAEKGQPQFDGPGF
jgi:putative FmdB family regulatory protein